MLQRHLQLSAQTLQRHTDVTETALNHYRRKQPSPRLLKIQQQQQVPSKQQLTTTNVMEIDAYYQRGKNKTTSTD